MDLPRWFWFYFAGSMHFRTWWTAQKKKRKSWFFYYLFKKVCINAVFLKCTSKSTVDFSRNRQYLMIGFGDNKTDSRGFHRKGYNRYVHRNEISLGSIYLVPFLLHIYNGIFKNTLPFILKHCKPYIRIYMESFGYPDFKRRRILVCSYPKIE